LRFRNSSPLLTPAVANAIRAVTGNTFACSASMNAGKMLAER